MVYKWYILPIGGLYATYHLLREPETTIEKPDLLFFPADTPPKNNMLLKKGTILKRKFRLPTMNFQDILVLRGIPGYLEKTHLLPKMITHITPRLMQQKSMTFDTYKNQRKSTYAPSGSPRSLGAASPFSEAERERDGAR